MHGTAMGTKMAVSFANLFMAIIVTEILSRGERKPLIWKRYIDDILSLWNTKGENMQMFIDLANNHHQTIKFMAEVSTTETTFLDTIIYNGERFRSDNILDIKTHFNRQENPFNTHIFPHVTLQLQREVLLKEKRSDFSTQTPLKNHLIRRK